VYKVLFLTHEPLTEAIAGPSIRVWELAHVLARQQPVTIGTPNENPKQSEHLDVRCFKGSALPRLVEQHEVVIAFGYLLRQHPIIARRAAFLAMDIYDPFVLENLHMHEGLDIRERLVVHQYDLDVVMEQLARADFFLCASERQRDYWLGALTMANRINPFTYQRDPALRRLIDVVPFGLPSEPPRPTQPAIKGVVPGIGRDDVVVLWGGGIWNWFDPLTAIRAVHALRAERPAVKLYFMGLRHPNPENPEMVMAQRAVALARELGVLGNQVFFREGWVPYAERVNFLCDADIGISLHTEHIETRLSYRTRILDYLWAGLPVIATSGDVLSDEIAAAAAGLAVPEGDLNTVVEALRGLAQDADRRGKMRTRARALAATHTWERAAEPLLAFCRDPWVAPDSGMPGLFHPRVPGRNTLRRAVEVWRTGGLTLATKKVLKRLERRLRERA
jgi:glycosyltransferase involved in cell wall biosynthesis